MGGSEAVGLYSVSGYRLVRPTSVTWKLAFSELKWRLLRFHKCSQLNAAEAEGESKKNGRISSANRAKE